MDRAIAEFAVAGPGISTTAAFLRETIGHPLFRAAKHDTGLVELVLEPAAE
jgi:acetyl-CoA carboxylase biotin carboxylase subunit